MTALRRTMAGIGIAALVVAICGMALVRLLPSRVSDWHVDPVAAVPAETPNRFLVGPEAGLAARPDRPAPVYALPPADLAAEIADVAEAQPRTALLAGSADGLWTTYVQRSRWIGFPDYISVRVLPTGEGQSTLAIYSRARFGRSDLGVNRARMEKWLAALARFER